jgi:cysteinyl-tRNA synthetase
MELRYVLASGHYRRPMNFTLDSLSDARVALARLARAAAALADRADGAPVPDFEAMKALPPPGAEDLFAAAWASLRDDLNTPEALGHVFSALKGLRPADIPPGEAERVFLSLHRVFAALGVALPSLDEPQTEVPPEIQALAETRWAAKQARDWGEADRLRDALLEKGWLVKDSKEGYTVSKA